MIKRLCLLLLLPVTLYAKDPVGWHWYNQPHHFKSKQANVVTKAFNSMSPMEQMKTLQYIFNNLRDKAILTGNVNDIANYKMMQDFFVNKATRFSVGWGEMLLQHPELNYNLQHPTSNQLAHDEFSKIEKRENKASDIIGKQYGFLFFYDTSQHEDNVYKIIVKRFTTTHHITTKYIDINDPLNKERAQQLGVNYYPAIMLFDPETHDHKIFRYGFGVDSDLAKRSYEIVSNWVPEY